MKNLSNSNFFGSTTIGKKGQVVIPIETRKAMRWKESEKLLVFGFENGMVILTKLSYAKKFANRVEKKTRKIRQIIEKSL